MSQRSGAGPGRAGQGSQSGPRSNPSGSQAGAQRPPPIPVGAVDGLLYRYEILTPLWKYHRHSILFFITRHPEDPSSTLNRDVLRLEYEYENLPNISNLSLAPERFPSRPGFGKRGTQVIIWANYFQLLVDPRLVLFQYNIDIQPLVVGRKRARIIELFFQQPESIARADRICSDFKSTLFSRALLDNEFTACHIKYRSEFEAEPGPRAQLYHLRLQHTSTLPVRRLIEHLETPDLSPDFDQKDALIQSLNISLHHFSKLQSNLITIGNKTFPKDATGRDLGGGLTAIRGFFSSVRAATGRILVNVNICCSAFYQPGPLVNIITAHGSRDKYRLEQLLAGARVKLTHTGTPRIATIKSLASTSDGTGSNQRKPKVPIFGAGPNQVQFWLQEQEQYVTVSEFFYKCKTRNLSNTSTVVTDNFSIQPIKFA